MSIIRERNIKHDEQDTSFWISYSDILSSLLIIILLITVYVVYELMNTKSIVIQNLEEVTNAEIVRKEVLDSIKEKLEYDGIIVEVVENNSVLRIPESTLFFESNQYRVPPDMRFNLMKIGLALLDELEEDGRSQYFNTIFIEGHTDRRASSREMGNWGLSTFRAISVWEFWDRAFDGRYSSLVNSSGVKLFSVSGYGDTRPITKQQVTEEELRSNRRIDIRFNIRNPTSMEFNEVLGIFDNSQQELP